MRNNHCEDYKGKKEFRALELILCKPVSDGAAYQCLDKSASERQYKGVEQCSEIFVFPNYRLVCVKRRVFRDKLNRYVNEVFACHERRRNLREERKQYNIGDTEQKYQSEDFKDYLPDKAPGKILNLKSRPFGGAMIQLLVLRALLEAARALHIEHGVPLDEIYLHIEDLLFRFENKLLGDTIERVGRDTKRKLSENDRLVGAAKLCYKHGIMPLHICLGIAAGYMFAPETDESSREVAGFVQNNGLNAALAQYSSIVDAGCDLALVIKRAYNLLDKYDKSFVPIIAELQKR